MISTPLQGTPPLTEITTVEECDALLSGRSAIVFKHSTACPVSWIAHREVTRFLERRPGTPIYLVSVRKRRDLSNLIAERTGVRHESPQVIVIQGGQVAATASHSDVTAEFLSSFA